MDEGQLSVDVSAPGSRLQKIADMPIIADGGKVSRWLQAQQRRGNGTHERGVVPYELVTPGLMLIRCSNLAFGIQGPLFFWQGSCLRKE